MKYKNAADIFPQALLKQIQKYVSGELVYIPVGAEKKRAWGETSGYRRYLAERNRDIRKAFYAGASIEELCDTFHLSFESIKRIVYTKKEEPILEYQCTLTSARAFAQAGKVDEWIHAYLLTDGHNRAFSDGLKLFDRTFIGPMDFPLALLSRCCGPEENMTYRVDAGWFESHVQKLMDALTKNPDMPPLIVHYVDSAFELNDGNHRLEALSRLGRQSYPVIVWITEESEVADFIAKYGDIVQSAPAIRG